MRRAGKSSNLWGISDRQAPLPLSGSLSQFGLFWTTTAGREYQMERPGVGSAITNKVKLVIWDLDETFWRGTLTEGGITPVASNVAMVKELSRRGIINSICSKNDYDQVKNALTELGIWEFFVFPHIQFAPKGQALVTMLEGAGLRAENVLFVDDNPSNLEEAKFFNPGIARNTGSGQFRPRG